MKLCIQVVILAIFVSTMAAFGQLACGAACPEDSFQLRYASNLQSNALIQASPGLGDSVINATNTGAKAGTTGNLGFSDGNLCLNFYVFDPGEEELACCACSITPNALVSTSVHGVLLSNNLTPEQPTAAVIKVLVTANAGTCNAGTITPSQLVSGGRIWGTTLHSTTGTAAGTTYGTETEFSHAGSTLSAGEFNRMVNTCSFIGSFSGYGICRNGVTGSGAANPACSASGLGAVGQ